MFTHTLMPFTLAQSEDGGSWFTDSDAGPNPIPVINAQIREHMDFLNHPDELSEMLGQISLVWAIIFLVVGGLCILHGYRWHKWVILILAAMSGIYGGMLLGEEVGGTRIVAVCMAVLCAVIAWPLLRFAVALFGGLAGAFAGANAWTALGFDSGIHEHGALIGLIVIGMLAFLAFRIVVILLTSIGGASLFVLGSLAALMHNDAWQGGMVESMHSNPLIVPILVASAAAFGIVFQLGGGLKGMNERANAADPTKKKKPATT